MVPILCSNKFLDLDNDFRSFGHDCNFNSQSEKCSGPEEEIISKRRMSQKF